MIELRLELVIIINKFSLTDLDKIEKIIKNMKSISLINKNILAAIIISVVIKIKKLKIQILELKTKLKNFKYIFRKDYNSFLITEKNRKSLYKRQNHKPVNKKNLKCYKCKKKNYFKFKCQSKPKN